MRPIFTTSRHAADFASIVRASASSRGIRRSSNSRTAATCMAVGKESLLDCPMLTWSLGWIGALAPSVPPSSWIARFEITSFTFMLLCVPEPVCQT